MNKNNLIFRITDLEVAKSPLDEKIVGIFRYDQNNKQKNGPILLIIAEIHSTLYAYERFLDTINSATEQTRYSISGVDQDPLARFEKLIDRLNTASADFVAQEAAPLAWNRINMFIVEFSDGQMCMTGIGKLMNLFLQKQEDATFRSFDIVGSIDQPTIPDPHKPFASILCGEMKEGDIFMIGTNNFERYRTDLELKERLTTVPAVTAVLDIQQDLHYRNIPDDFVAAIITCTENKKYEPEIHEEPIKETGESSVLKLHATETEAISQLHPKVTAENVVQNTKSFVLLLKDLREIWTKKIKEFFRKKPRTRKDPVTIASLRGMNFGYGARFTKKHMRICAAIGIGFLTIVSGYIFWRYEIKKAAETAAWQSTYNQIIDLKNRIDSDLIYGNETKAKTEMKQAEQLLATITAGTSDRKKTLTSLITKLSDSRNKMKKIVQIDTAIELATLPPDTAPESLSGLVRIDDLIYITDNAKHTVLKINIVTHDIKRIPLPKIFGSTIKALDTKEGILFINQNSTPYVLHHRTDQFSSVSWTHTHSSSTTIDSISYAGKIYSIDGSANHIWRSVYTGNEYGPETNYVKAISTDISTAVGIAIDSNVYVLKSDGTLIQFTAGAQTGFALTSIDPPLTSASRIWTDTDSSLIAILDSVYKRILLFDKNGNLLMQIQSQQFQNPSDMTIDEAKKRLIVQDSNKIWLLQLP